MKTSKLLDAICDALQRDPGTLSLDDTPTTVGEWDSVGHLVILATVEHLCGARIDSPDIQNFRSLRELVEALRSQGVTLED